MLLYPVTKHHERIQKFEETGELNYVYKNKLNKVCFAQDTAYTNSKNLAKRTVSDKVLKNKAYEVALNPKYDGYQRRLPSMAYKCFDKKIGSGMSANVNEVLPQELHKLLTKNSKRIKLYARFKDNIWAADLAYMGSISSENGGIKYLQCVIDVFTKYAWVKPLNDKKLKQFFMVLLKY